VAKLTFRNSKGNLVDIPTVAATRVKNEFGKILDKATHGGAVAITRHSTPRAVLVDYEEFQSLVKARSTALDDLGAEFDSLLVRMQTAKSRKALNTAFHASPAELGRAAVKAARKRR
jgi:antitoxin Phd